MTDMVSSPSTRPALGYRAVSDIAPLTSPRPDLSKGELGRGTQATSAGARVISGHAMALGGRAPFSPFLPLPPAPSTDVFQLGHHDGQPGIHAAPIHEHMTEDEARARLVEITNEIYPRRASSNDIAQSSRPITIVAAKQQKANARPAPFMIRSYSMPVATQKAYEAEQRAQRLRRQQQQQVHSHLAWSVMSRINSNEVLGDDVSPATSPLRAAFSSSEVEHEQMGKTMASKLGDAVAAIADSASSSSGSDETEVSTPRATSPFDEGDYFTNKSDDAFDVISNILIHPDHLQSPPAWPAFN